MAATRDDGGAVRYYSRPARLFHWLTVAMVVALVIISLFMEALPLGPEKFLLYNFHKSLGLTVMVIALLRLVWRRIMPPPPLPVAMKSWERSCARASHATMYILLLVQPVVGVVHSWATDYPIVVYGLFAIPNPMSADAALKELLEEVHEILGWGLVALVAVYVAAALKHHVIDRNDVLHRMLPSIKPRDGS